METTYKETNLSMALGLGLVAIGIYVAVKNYKNPGFWPGVLALALVGGSIGVKIYDKK